MVLPNILPLPVPWKCLKPRGKIDTIDTIFEEFNWLFFFSGSLNEVVILPSFQIAVLCPLNRPNSSKHQKILKSSCNWFKYWHSSAAPAAECQLLVYLAIFMVTSTTICINYKAQTMCKTRFDSQGMILNDFLQKKTSLKKR